MPSPESATCMTAAPGVALAASLSHEPEQALWSGMPFPTSWDPYVTTLMTLEQIYRYPVLHDDHHRRQLTLPTDTATGSGAARSS